MNPALSMKGLRSHATCTQILENIAISRKVLSHTSMVDTTMHTLQPPHLPPPTLLALHFTLKPLQLQNMRGRLLPTVRTPHNILLHGRVGTHNSMLDMKSAQ
ncbi:unnamed protein product [Ectocarpus sp. 12 AP-2014]